MSQEENKEKKVPETEAKTAPKAEGRIDKNVSTPKVEGGTAKNVSTPKAEGVIDKNVSTPKTGGGERRGFSSFKSRQKTDNADENGIVERVIKINRVSKVVKGGKNFSFSALVVSGDGKGSVGMGFGKSNEVVEAIKKGTAKAKKSFFKVNVAGDTIPHEVIGAFKASRILLKPAGAGTGVIAGGPVRAICDAVGVKNILTKSLGSRNAINVVRATLEGFKKLRLKRRG